MLVIVLFHFKIRAFKDQSRILQALIFSRDLKKDVLRLYEFAKGPAGCFIYDYSSCPSREELSMLLPFS